MLSFLKLGIIFNIEIKKPHSIKVIYRMRLRK